jgi:hypothetical protein
MADAEVICFTPSPQPTSLPKLYVRVPPRTLRTAKRNSPADALTLLPERPRYTTPVLLPWVPIRTRTLRGERSRSNQLS